MISPNLKIGDTFEDGGRKFKVIGMSELGPISRLILPGDKEDKSVLPFVEVPNKPEPENKLDSFNSYTKTEINRLSVAELEKVCAKLNIPVGTGVEMKKAIITRLDL